MSAEPAGCEWRIPDDALLEDMRGLRCVLPVDHDGGHVVGVSGPGYAMLWRVDAQRRTVTQFAHARLDRGETFSYAQLGDMADVSRAGWRAMQEGDDG